MMDVCIMRTVTVQLAVAWTLLTILLPHSDGKVNLHRPLSDEPELIRLSEEDDTILNEHIRARRSASDTTPLASDNRRLDVHSIVLKDQKHNEAIVHWSGNYSNVMFVLTREHQGSGHVPHVPDSKLWRSVNYGETFSPVDLPRDAIIRYYYSCPLNKRKLVFTDAKVGKIYYTDDEGQSLKLASAVEFNPDKLVFHPTREDWLLGYSYQEKSLHYSKDLARNWTKLADYVNARFYWAAAGLDESDAIVHYEKLDPLTGHYNYIAMQLDADAPAPVVIDPDLGPIDVDSLIVQNEYIFVQRSTPFSTSLWVSYERQPFHKALFPGDVHPQDFRIVNTNEGQVFIAADHQEKLVHLYLSDKTGRFYIKSLQNLVALRPSGGAFDVDLYEVQGVKGTYIANVYTKNNPVTMITFDQGAIWDKISAPNKNAKKQDSHCQLPSCSLHIHLGFSQAVNNIPYILSEANAPGIIFAQGHMGADLAPGTDTQSTLFMSRDGGLTWKALFDGEFNYNILDQGGAMVVIPVTAHTKTRKIYYSCTEGSEWKPYTFSDLDLQVDGVLNEPGITTLIVSIYGHVNHSAGWVIIKVNFSSILSEKCSADQYDSWTPTDNVPNHHCLLGERITYNRRKQEAECYNGRHYERAISKHPCECIDEDYECDYGYKRNEKGDCVLMSWFKPDEPAWECPEGTSYNKSKGYRKIASDNCENPDKVPEKYQLVSTPCPVTKPAGLHIHYGSRLAVATGTSVQFSFSQEQGSRKTTQYSWNFGEKGQSDIIKTGYDTGHTLNHTYLSHGVYRVSLKAQNREGSDTIHTYIKVEDVLRGVQIDQPRAAHVGHQVEFRATAVTQNLSRAGQDSGIVHYIWTFGDEGDSTKPLLTYDSEVNHVYKTAGNFSASVEAANSMGSIFRKFLVTVYATLTTVQLSFSHEVEQLNDRTEVWMRLFADSIKEMLVRELDTSAERLEVSVLDDALTRADVSVLPVDQTANNDPTVNTIVDSLLLKVNEGDLYLNLNEGSPFETKVTVIDANIYKESTDSGKHEEHYLGVILAVPTLVASGFIAMMIVVYYKKKFSTVRRYNVLQSHSAEDDDHLLGEDDDDDDPPLDPNPDFGQEPAPREFGMQSALVMMTGTNNRDENGSVNC